MLTEHAEVIKNMLLSKRISDNDALVLQTLIRTQLRLEHENDDQISKRLIAESDRDNRRRRMDLARAILDETQVHDLDAVAEIIWPTTESEYAPVMHPVAPYPMTDFKGTSVPAGVRCEFDEVSETLDGQSIYRRGSEVQSVPFDNKLGGGDVGCKVHNVINCDWCESFEEIGKRFDICQHVGCGALADPSLKNGYCAQHFSEGQPLASAPIDQPTILNTGDHQKQPNESDPRCPRWYGVSGFDELRCIKNRGHGGECTIDVPFEEPTSSADPHACTCSAPFNTEPGSHHTQSCPLYVDRIS